MAERQSGEVKIRRARPGDVFEIANVHVNSWRETYRGLLPESYLAKLNFRKKINAWQRVVNDTQRFVVFVAEDRVGVIGFATFEAARDPEWLGHGEVTSIYLLSRFHGRGIGRALLNAGLRELRSRNFTRAYCWVLAGNPTVSFYERSGARFTGQTKDDEIEGLPITEQAFVWENLD